MLVQMIDVHELLEVGSSYLSKEHREQLSALLQEKSLTVISSKPCSLWDRCWSIIYNLFTGCAATTSWDAGAHLGHEMLDLLYPLTGTVDIRESSISSTFARNTKPENIIVDDSDNEIAKCTCLTIDCHNEATYAEITATLFDILSSLKKGNKVRNVTIRGLKHASGSESLVQEDRQQITSSLPKSCDWIDISGLQNDSKIDPWHVRWNVNYR